MKILLLGTGGREHALALKLASSETSVQLYIVPGSDALGQVGTCLPFSEALGEDLLAWAEAERPDLVIVGPEAPLVAGLSDALTRLGLNVFGHPQATARLEGSKAFAKAFMARHRIPCAWSRTIGNAEEGTALIQDWPCELPIVLKADGLAAGKGVVLAESKAEALETLHAFLGGQFGEAGHTIVFEEPLVGLELSLHVLVDVTPDRARFSLLPACQDHKRIFEGDRGPNTGGMGAFGPIPFLRPADLLRLRDDLVAPTIRGLQSEGLVGRGVLFLGVMWTAEGPKLLEYNVRFGDPETQVLMQLLDEDLPSLLLEIAEHRFDGRELKLHPGCALAVVLAAEGYPGPVKRDVPITLGTTRSTVIHAGTRRSQGAWVTQGGRVLNLCARGGDLASARAQVAQDLEAVTWPGRQVRADIGLKALRHAVAGKTIEDPW